VAEHRDTAAAMAGPRRGLAVPCFAEDPADLVALGIAAERAGLDGFFLWDHLVHSNTGDGPPIVDPWQVLAVIAAGTTRIRLGTMITPVARRRPWKLAKEATTLDLLSGGRVILGVGLGAPAGEFTLFGEPAGARRRAELLDEGLDVLAGLWSGHPFSYAGSHYTVGPVSFTPTPRQRPRVPVWVGGELPAAGPVARAARWDGFVPIHRERPDGVATPHDIAAVLDRIGALRGSTEGFDIAVWGTLDASGQLAGVLPDYAAAGATWWLESVKSRPGWLEAVRERLRRPPEVKSRRG
jgi:alkanesulfonate monooxygenase SsuD/methylene tetrahydromethanopterin reductase-like flavin-dependent oxidoreductase (luciferase family)